MAIGTADGHAGHKLAAPCQSERELQARDVDTGDQQDETNGARERDQNALDVDHPDFAHLLNRRAFTAVLFVFVAERRTKALDVITRLLVGNVLTQSPGDEKRV